MRWFRSFRTCRWMPVFGFAEFPNYGKRHAQICMYCGPFICGFLMYLRSFTRTVVIGDDSAFPIVKLPTVFETAGENLTSFECIRHKINDSHVLSLAQHCQNLRRLVLVSYGSETLSPSFSFLQVFGAHIGIVEQRVLSLSAAGALVRARLFQRMLFCFHLSFWKLGSVLSSLVNYPLTICDSYSFLSRSFSLISWM